MERRRITSHVENDERCRRAIRGQGKHFGDRRDDDDAGFHDNGIVPRLRTRQYDRRVKRRLERLVLGWVMAVGAYLLDRRLRRAR